MSPKSYTIVKIARTGLETHTSVKIICITNDVMIMDRGYMYIRRAAYYSRPETAAMKRTGKSNSIVKGQVSRAFVIIVEKTPSTCSRSKVLKCVRQTTLEKPYRKIIADDVVDLLLKI